MLAPGVNTGQGGESMMDYVLGIYKALGSKPNTKKNIKIYVLGIMRNLYKGIRSDWILREEKKR